MYVCMHVVCMSCGACGVVWWCGSKVSGDCGDCGDCGDSER